VLSKRVLYGGAYDGAKHPWGLSACRRQAQQIPSPHGYRIAILTTFSVIMKHFISKKCLFILSALSLGLITSLGISEVALICIDYQPTYRDLFDTYTYSLDPDRLYRLLPDKANGINRRGYRGKLSQRESHKRRILFLGDSFVYGIGVKEDQSLPSRLAYNLNDAFDIINMGIPGYGPDQSFIQLQQEFHRYKPHLVILNLYPANDFGDLRRNDIYRLEGDSLIRNKTNLVSRHLPFLRLIPLLSKVLYGSFFSPDIEKHMVSSLFIDYYENLSVINQKEANYRTKLLQKILENMAHYLAREHSLFFVTIIPSNESLNEEFPTLRKREYSQPFSYCNEIAATNILTKLDLPYLDMTEALEKEQSKYAVFIKNDNHLTVEAIEYTSRSLADSLTQTFEDRLFE
jgi:hypothetical protein